MAGKVSAKLNIAKHQMRKNRKEIEPSLEANERTYCCNFKHYNKYIMVIEQKFFPLTDCGWKGIIMDNSQIRIAK